MQVRTIAFHHFGCKVNFAEGSSISRQFLENGYSLIDFREKADVYVISTCVVTAVAEKKCRAAIRQAHKINPEAKIAVIGCYSELKPTEIASIDGVSVVLGHSAKFNLFEEIEHLDSTTGYGHHPVPVGEFVPSYSFSERTRSFLKIQDGCDYYCSYCTIPFARGHSRSDTIQNVLSNIRKIAAEGMKEIILTGVNIGDFGRETGETFTGLIKALEKDAEIPRLRISSIEPDLLNQEIIEIIAGSKKFMPHFHIPLQSGSDPILKAMKRKYDTRLFASRITKIKEMMPDACIACDVITGFPGETVTLFQETLTFLENLDISYLHVFNYSKRDLTLAAGLADPVPDKTRKERSELLHALSVKKKHHFYLQNEGKVASVLFESDHSDGFMQGFTENYIRVKTPFDQELVNQIILVRLEEVDEEGIFTVQLLNPEKIKRNVQQTLPDAAS